MTKFANDEDFVKTKINLLNNHAVLNYYEKGWDAWYQ